ncbi:hypothetical protein EDB83DRAFT_2432197 [Lactarius deliciosus]|nr:hypothetical protein EDB83DRAFT_2432197 [Lactarius deliciosus]
MVCTVLYGLCMPSYISGGLCGNQSQPPPLSSQTRTHRECSRPKNRCTVYGTKSEGGADSAGLAMGRPVRLRMD